tara:strand:- start:527 stop:937 length:411 start_codon:yes stop_codon:yes gene_type:complete
VVDANVVFSSLIRKGKPLRVFELNDIFKRFEFISSEYLFTEIGRRFDKVLKITDFSKEELSHVFSLIKNQINLMPTETFEDKLDEAIEKAPHDKDAPYVALSLKLDCKIFSGDKGLKKTLPNKVENPSEVLDILLA